MNLRFLIDTSEDYEDQEPYKRTNRKRNRFDDESTPRRSDRKRKRERRPQQEREREYA